MPNYQFAVLNSSIFIAVAQLAPNPIVALLMATLWIGLAVLSQRD